MKKIVLMMAAAVCLIGCGKKDAQKTQEAERVEVVSTMVLENHEIERVLNISTNLQGYLTQNVAPSLTGKIEHIFVEVGDRVKEGDMLVRMDQNQYLTSKIQLANLEVEMSRLEALLATGSVSQQTYDQTREKGLTAQNLQNGMFSSCPPLSLTPKIIYFFRLL